MPSAAPVSSALALPGWIDQGTRRGGLAKCTPAAFQVLGLWRPTVNSEGLHTLDKGPLPGEGNGHVQLLQEESLEEPHGALSQKHRVRERRNRPSLPLCERGV